MKDFTKISGLVLVVMLITFGVKAQNLQISGGYNFSVSLCSDGKIYAWGDNSVGQLGRDATNTRYGVSNSTSPVPVYLPSANSLTMKQVDAGSGSTGISLACDGSVWTWGGNCGNGNIGNGSTGGTPCHGVANDGINHYSAMQRVVGGAQGGAFLTNIIYINASTISSFAVENTGRVLAWGNNAGGTGPPGALGNGINTNVGNTYTPSYVLTAAGTPLTGISVVEGSDYSGYALSTTGFVYSWGGNSGGNNDLGRPFTAADQFYANRVKAWDYSKNDGTLVDLSNIVKITAGDTHGLAIDASGNLWSWGGDWGSGQRGWGATGTAVPYATKVVAVGTSCANEQWKFGPWLTGAVEISAGQQHSIVLLNDGKVVTFGDNSSGQLGNGGGGDSGCPVYVKTAAATDLTGIVSVSDGDLWSFALNSAGQVYVWGENANGELALAGADRNYATLNPVIPTACSGSLLPCPIAALGQDILKCPGTSVNLLAGDNGDTYEYTWYSGPSATGPWTQIGAANRPYAAGAGATLSVTIPLFYRVVIRDTRTYVADKCGPCTNSEDIIQVIDRTPPVATGSAGTCATSVCFDITSTGAVDNDAFDWYATQATATKLNTAGTVNPFCTAKSNLTLVGGNWEIWVEDMRTFQANVGAPTQPCAPSSKSDGTNEYQQLIVYDNTITLNSVNVYYQSDHDDGQAYTMTVTVWPNDPNKYSSAQDGPNTPVLHTRTVNFTETNTGGTKPWELKSLTGLGINLTGSAAGTKYWVRVVVNSTGQLGLYSCGSNPAYPLSDTDPARDHVVMRGYSSGGIIEQLTYKAPALNWGFNYTDGYPCGRFKLTAPDATTSCLPVDFLDFSGENKGRTNVLYWATSFEENSDYFEVQRSYDGEHWTTVGVVDAAGNSSVIQEYTFTDASSKNGLAYYRIVEKDFDGAATVSSAISLTTTSGGNISVHPNPNNGEFTIETNGVLGDHTSIQLLDALGRLVYQSTENFSFKSVSKELSLTDLENGMYFLNISDGSYSSSQKLIVE